MNDQPSPEVMAQAKAAGLRRGDSFSYSNDSKAEAAHHPGDASVTRPDLDALIAKLRLVSNGLGPIPVAVQAADALAAERARADQASARTDQAEQRIADALKSLADHMPPYGMELRPDGSEDPQAAAYVEGYGTAYRPVHQILSAAPTAEQGALS